VTSTVVRIDTVASIQTGVSCTRLSLAVNAPKRGWTAARSIDARPSVLAVSLNERAESHIALVPCESCFTDASSIVRAGAIVGTRHRLALGHLAVGARVSLPTETLPIVVARPSVLAGVRRHAGHLTASRSHVTGSTCADEGVDEVRTGTSVQTRIARTFVDVCPTVLTCVSRNTRTGVGTNTVNASGSVQTTMANAIIRKCLTVQRNILPTWTADLGPCVGIAGVVSAGVRVLLDAVDRTGRTVEVGVTVQHVSHRQTRLVSVSESVDSDGGWLCA